VDITTHAVAGIYFLFSLKKKRKKRKKNVIKIELYISYIAYIIPLSFKVPDIFKYPGLLN